MKQCPKCKAEHNNSGTFCSRSCANSRVFSDESKFKKSIALKGRKPTGVIADKEAWARKIKETALQKYLAKSFDELGMENKRRRVFEEQKYCCNKLPLSARSTLSSTCTAPRHCQTVDYRYDLVDKQYQPLDSCYGHIQHLM